MRALHEQGISPEEYQRKKWKAINKAKRVMEKVYGYSESLT